jgi:hypothetical protein
VVPEGGTEAYSASVRVMDPIKNRTKYHLIYITRHPKGIKEFMEQSEKLDMIQPQLRAQAKFDRNIQQRGAAQTSLGLDHLMSGVSPTDDPFAVVDVKGYWLSKLSTVPKVFGLVEMVQLLSESGCYLSTLQQALGELIAEGRVKNLDAKRKRSKNHVDFDKGEHLIRI